MISNIEDFYEQAQAVIPAFDEFITLYDLRNDVKADHINYKCESSESFESIRRIFELDSRFIYQSIISGRRIDLVGLKKNLETSVGAISLLELSDQKPDRSQKEVFDHIEIYPVVQMYEDFLEILEKKFFDKGIELIKKALDIQKVDRPHHTTHDIRLENGFLVRLTKESLVSKVKRDEMV